MPGSNKKLWKWCQAPMSVCKSSKSCKECNSVNKKIAIRKREKERS